MTYREYMTEKMENIGWCKPLSFLNGKVIVAMTGGNVSSIQIDGKDVECSPENIKAVAKMVNKGYDLYHGWSDSVIIGDATEGEMPCCKCPWFNICGAMDGI